MGRTRRALALRAAVATASLLASAATLGLSASPALADPAPVVLVSTDGVSYQPSLTVGLFADAGLLVPGDTATSELWIENPTTDPATVRVSVGDITTSSLELGDNMVLTALDTANLSTVTATWNQLADCDIMVQPITVAGGAKIEIDLSLTMLNAPGLVAQHQDGALTANVEMRDAAAGSFPISTCNPGTTDPGTTSPGTTEPASTSPRKILGYTGDTFPTQLLLLGGILVGVGWFMLAARGRRKRSEAQR